MKRTLKKIFLWSLMIGSFLIFWNTQAYTPLTNDIWSTFTKSWYTLQVKDLNSLYDGKLDLSSFKDLNLTNDWVFSANKNALDKINQEKKELNKKIDTILSKIKTREQTIDNVDNQYKKYIEIENDINNSDFIYTLALPTNKFLIKETEYWSNKWSIVITRDPVIKGINGWAVDPELKSIIDSEIAEIRQQNTIQEMAETIKKLFEKQWRDYSPLFIEKSMEQFFKDITISISSKDKKFAQDYTYRNKEYMNSTFYLPEKLKELESKTDKYIFFYIPLRASNPAVNNVLWGIDENNRSRVFKESSDFCFKIDYMDNHQIFNDNFCSLNEFFAWGKMKVKSVDIEYLNNYYISLDKLWWLSVIIQLAIIVWFAFLPLTFIKYIDKIINFWTKFETEQL